MRCIGFGLFMVACITLGGCLVKPEPAPVQLKGDLLRTYKQGDLMPGAVFVVPAAYETNLGQLVRSAFVDALKRDGYTVVPEGDGIQLSLLVDIDGASPKARTRTVLQVAAPPTISEARPGQGPRLNDQVLFDGVSIGYRPGSGKVSKHFETLRVRIALRDDEDDLWTGVAHAYLDGRSRTGLAVALGDVLGRTVGQDAHIPATRFEPLAPGVIEVSGEDAEGGVILLP